MILSENGGTSENKEIDADFFSDVEIFCSLEGLVVLVFRHVRVSLSFHLVHFVPEVHLCHALHVLQGARLVLVPQLLPVKKVPSCCVEEGPGSLTLDPADPRAPASPGGPASPCLPGSPGTPLNPLFPGVPYTPTNEPLDHTLVLCKVHSSCWYLCTERVKLV